MSALSSKLRSLEDGSDGHRLAFMCPGCKETHAVGIGSGPGPRWGWNGDAVAPTFTPSILATGHRFINEVSDETEPFTCHSFVTAGRIQFLGDCTHALAAQTVDLPDWVAP